ncbi:ABC transporter permease (plasmid) [Pseudarthrobacter sp. P1]|uniref:ABC transporter permease n=1 Tax=Pseudarthrobacter sp. P1 TaxID=3418418 RepID=UPI003CF27284
MAKAITTPTDSGSVRPEIGLIFGALLRADFTVLLRSGRTLLLNFAVPIFILVIIGLRTKGGTSAFAGPGFIIGLALTYGLMASSLIGYSNTIARDRDAGVFQRLRVTPAPTWAIMASRLAVQIVVDLIMTIIVVVLGGIITNTVFSPGQYLLLVCVSILGGAMFLAIAQALVALVRSAAVINAVGRILYIVFLLLGLLGASGILGTTIHAVANWSPVGAMINLYAGVLNLSGWDWTDTIGLIGTAGYTVVGAFIGIRWFRWDAR